MPDIRRCAIYGCRSNSRDNKSLKLFNFPTRENPLYEIWLSICHESSEKIRLQKRPYICSKHFNERDVGFRRLATGALPALFLTAPPGFADEENARLAEIAAAQDEKKRLLDLVNDTVFEWVLRTQHHAEMALACTTRRELRRIATEARDLIGATLIFRIDDYWLRKFRLSHMTRLELMLLEDDRRKKTLDLASIIYDLNPSIRILSQDEIEVLVEEEEARFIQMEIKKRRPRTNTKYADPDPENSAHTSLSSVNSPKFGGKTYKRKKTSSFNDHLSDFYSPSGDNMQDESPSSENQFDTKSEMTESVVFSDDSFPDFENSEDPNQATKTESIIDSYEQALEYLKPLEDFALRQENYRAIGLLTTLEIIFKGPRQQQ